MTTIQDDEIDLRELWATIVKRKMTILIVTAVAAIAAVAYAWTAKPIYSGDVLIEIGDVIINSEATNDKPTIIQTLDSSSNLKEIVAQLTKDTENDIEISVDTPNGSSNLIQLTLENSDTALIQQKLQEATETILQRLQTKATFYQQANAQIRPSAVIGSISVTPDPIKPKKQLIVAIGLITGLILGIFMAFFIEFIQNGKTRREP